MRSSRLQPKRARWDRRRSARIHRRSLRPEHVLKHVREDWVCGSVVRESCYFRGIVRPAPVVPRVVPVAATSWIRDVESAATAEVGCDSGCGDLHPLVEHWYMGPWGRRGLVESSEDFSAARTRFGRKAEDLDEIRSGVGSVVRRKGNAVRHDDCLCDRVDFLWFSSTWSEFVVDRPTDGGASHWATMPGESARNLSRWTEFLWMRTRTAILSTPLTRELPWGQYQRAMRVPRNLSTTLRHRRLGFTEQAVGSQPRPAG